MREKEASGFAQNPLPPLFVLGAPQQKPPSSNPPTC